MLVGLFKSWLFSVTKIMILFLLHYTKIQMMPLGREWCVKHIPPKNNLWMLLTHIKYILVSGFETAWIQTHVSLQLNLMAYRITAIFRRWHDSSLRYQTTFGISCSLLPWVQEGFCLLFLKIQDFFQFYLVLYNQISMERK